MSSDAAVTVRPGNRDEVPVLQRIERDADAAYADAGHPELSDGEVIPSNVALAAIDRGDLMVAATRHGPVGWIYIGRLGPELCIGQMSVAPEFGRRGIGTMLLEYAIDQARRAGERTIVLNTQGDVPWNRPWYERHGFVVLGPEEWTPAMRTLTEQQREIGLNWNTRVHMRLTVS